MDIESIFWQAITMIECQEMLVDMKVSDFPHLKTEARKKIHRDIYKQAHPKVFENKEPMTTERLGKFLGRKLNG